jgi:hypothetical protein
MGEASYGRRRGEPVYLWWIWAGTSAASTVFDLDQDEEAGYHNSYTYTKAVFAYSLYYVSS